MQKISNGVKRILAIETSCDETAISIVEFGGSVKKLKIKILANLVSSQVKLHAKFGGVVPNLAKREHQRNLVPVLLSVLTEAKLKESRIKNQEIRINKNLNSKFLILNSILGREPKLLKKFIKYILSLAPPKIDAIAVTVGPGLAPALWVGVNFARALACLWKKPIIPVNHMAGHIFSAFLQKSIKENSKFPPSLKLRRTSKIQIIKFPALALLVSGGHTELVLMRGYGKYKIIGETLDDAAGEAFDKVARLLGLGYPGGPHIAAVAQYAQKTADKTQNHAETIPRISALSLRKSAGELKFPRPMINSKDFNFSFSGLKTAVLYLLEDLKKKKASIKKLRPQIANEFQNAVVDVLVKKTIRAAKKYNVKTLMMGGGVAANKELRKRLGEMVKKEIPNLLFLIPDLSLTGDNALMIALAAYFSGKKKAWNKIHAEPNLRLD